MATIRIPVGMTDILILVGPPKVFDRMVRKVIRESEGKHKG